MTTSGISKWDRCSHNPYLFALNPCISPGFNLMEIHEVIVKDIFGNEVSASFLCFTLDMYQYHKYETITTKLKKYLINKLKNIVKSYDDDYLSLLETYIDVFRYDISNMKRQTLSMWFSQYGQVMFEREIIPTGAMVKYPSSIVSGLYDTIRLGDVYWIFPWDNKTTGKFLDELYLSCPKYKIHRIERQYNVFGFTLHYWMPYNYNRDMINKIKPNLLKLIVVELLTSVFDKFNILNNNSLIIHYIADIVKDEYKKDMRNSEYGKMLDWISNPNGKYKLKPSIKTFMKCIYSKVPVSFELESLSLKSIYKSTNVSLYKPKESMTMWEINANLLIMESSHKI